MGFSFSAIWGSSIFCFVSNGNMEAESRNILSFTSLVEWGRGTPFYSGVTYYEN